MQGPWQGGRERRSVASGIALVPELIAFVGSPDAVPIRNLLYSAMALLVGFLYLIGLVSGTKRGSQKGGQPQS